jgi:hypothetical protein
MRKHTKEPIEHDAKEKTSPRGMAPDKAHATCDATAGGRNSETEETYNNAPQNAESRQTQRLK